MTIERDLLDLDPEDAVELKFQLGRARHGPEWVGKRPILEAHEEVLDALAYVREEIRAAGLPELVLMELYMTLLNALRGVRVLVATVEDLEGRDGSQDRVEVDWGKGPYRTDESQRGDEGV